MFGDQTSRENAILHEAEIYKSTDANSFLGSS